MRSRWGSFVAFLIRDNRWLVAVHDGDNRVGCSEVDSDDFFALSHYIFLKLDPLVHDSNPAFWLFFGSSQCFKLTKGQRREQKPIKNGKGRARN